MLAPSKMDKALGIIAQKLKERGNRELLARHGSEKRDCDTGVSYREGFFNGFQFAIRLIDDALPRKGGHGARPGHFCKRKENK